VRSAPTLKKAPAFLRESPPSRGLAGSSCLARACPESPGMASAYRLASRTAMIPARKTPSKVPAPTIEAADALSRAGTGLPEHRRRSVDADDWLAGRLRDRVSDPPVPDRQLDQRPVRLPHQVAGEGDVGHHVRRPFLVAVRERLVPAHRHMLPRHDQAAPINSAARVTRPGDRPGQSSPGPPKYLWLPGECSMPRPHRITGDPSQHRPECRRAGCGRSAVLRYRSGLPPRAASVLPGVSGHGGPPLAALIAGCRECVWTPPVRGEQNDPAIVNRGGRG
jgi:hypothetical protein